MSPWEFIIPQYHSLSPANFYVWSLNDSNNPTPAFFLWPLQPMPFLCLYFQMVYSIIIKATVCLSNILIQSATTWLLIGHIDTFIVINLANNPAVIGKKQINVSQESWKLLQNVQGRHCRSRTASRLTTTDKTRPSRISMHQSLGRPSVQIIKHHRVKSFITVA